MSEKGPKVLLPRDDELVPSFMFEALFVRGLEVKGPLAETLRRAGFDPERLEVAYSRALFRRCMDLCRLHLYPDLSWDDAYAALGRALGAGFQTTQVGRVIGSSASQLGPVAYVRRFPNYLKMTPDAPVPHFVQVGPTSVRLEFRDTSLLPGFIRGLLDFGVRMTGVTPVITAHHLGLGSYDILVQWD